MKKNILCILAVGAALFTFTMRAAAVESEDGFKPIFNGKDLSGWDMQPVVQPVENITVKSTLKKADIRTATLTISDF